MTAEEAIKILDNERVPCPRCGAYNGFMAKGTFTQYYDAAGRPSGYDFDGTESSIIKCVNCGARFRRERLWKED